MKKIFAGLIVVIMLVSAVAFAETKIDKMNNIALEMEKISDNNAKIDAEYNAYYDIITVRETLNLSATKIAVQILEDQTFYDNIYEINDLIVKIVGNIDKETTVFLTFVSNDNFPIRAFINGSDVTSMLWIDQPL